MKRILFFSLVSIFLAGCAALFAPRITDTFIHRNRVFSREDCLSCHLEGKDGAPKAPKAMLKEGRRNCVRCHK